MKSFTAIVVTLTCLFVISEIGAKYLLVDVGDMDGHKKASATRNSAASKIFWGIIYVNTVVYITLIDRTRIIYFISTN